MVRAAIIGAIISALAMPVKALEIPPEILVSNEIEYSREDILCLAQNAYFEARNDTVEAQVAVTHVVLNRAKSRRYPNTVCEVVWDDYQFSWTHDGKGDIPRNKDAWVRSLAVVLLVLENRLTDPTNGAMFYHAHYVKPYWASHMKHARNIGKHRFYK